MTQSRRRWYFYVMDLVAFVAVLLLIEAALKRPQIPDQLGRPSGWGHLGGAMANLTYYGKTDPPDIIILGNSQAYRAINPYVVSDTLLEMTGEYISIVNNGVSWMGAAGDVRIMLDLFAKFYMPKIIMLIVSPYMFGDLPPQDWKAVTEGTSASLWFDDKPYTPIARWFLRHSLLWQYSNNLAYVLAGKNEPVYVSSVSRGYEPRTDIGQNLAEFGAGSYYPEYTYRNQGTIALEKLIAWCEEHDILLVLFTAPEHESMLVNGQEIYDTFLADMRSFAASSLNVIFLDLTTEGRLTDANYYDVLHVNDSGATHWSERLARFMVQNQVLQRGKVGIVKVYGDDWLTIFHHETPGFLEFYAIQADGSGGLAAQIPAAEWEAMQEGDLDDFEGGGFRFELEKREAQFFWIRMYKGDQLLSDGPFAIQTEQR